MQQDSDSSGSWEDVLSSKAEMELRSQGQNIGNRVHAW